MASHAYGADSPGLLGRHHWGAGSVGIPGALIAAGGYLDSSIDQTAEATDEFYGLLGGVPSGLVLEEVGEDGGIVASSPVSNAVYAVPFDLYRWGVKFGSSKFTATFGTPAAGANLSALTMTAGGAIAGGAVSYDAPVAGVTNLAGAPVTGGAAIAGGAISFVPAIPGVVDLAGSVMVGGSTIGISAATTPGAAVYLVGAPMSGGSAISTGAITNQVYARAPAGAGYIPQHTCGPVRPANTEGCAR